MFDKCQYIIKTGTYAKYNVYIIICAGDYNFSYLKNDMVMINRKQLYYCHSEFFL